MAKFIEDIKFGIGLGIGLLIAYGVLRLVVWLLNMVLSGAPHQLHMP